MAAIPPPPVAQFKTEFERARRWRRSRREPLQLDDIRWEALDRFLALGFPTTLDQEWRFTNIDPIAEKIFTLAAEPANDTTHQLLSPFPLTDEFGAQLVCLDGYCLSDVLPIRNLPAGVRLESLSKVLDSKAADVDTYLTRVALFKQQPFVAMNTALFTDGACVLIPPHTVIERPIHVRFISTGEADRRPAMSHPRVLVVVDDYSHATIVESYTGPEGVQYFTNVVREIVLGRHAALDYYQIQCEGGQAYHTSATYIVAASSAGCLAHSVNLGGELVRNEVVAVLGGESVNWSLKGLYLVDRERLIDNHTSVEHSMPYCRSNHVYHGIVTDRGKSVFDGKVRISANAHNTNAKQTNHALLLSDRAQINSAAQFENSARKANYIQRTVTRNIADEVQHYIRSRGLAEEKAHQVVIRAFVRHMLKSLDLQPLASHVGELIQQRLGLGKGD
jgi:Fe-S cluster assembly protein SufD